jgi:hypothetical protein
VFGLLGGGANKIIRLVLSCLVLSYWAGLERYPIALHTYILVLIRFLQVFLKGLSDVI